MSAPLFTPGPWRWEAKVSPTRDGRRVHPEIRLVTSGIPGGYTVMDFERMGMAQARPRFLVGGLMKPYGDFVPAPDHNGYGLLVHPDARLIASAPELYAALEDALGAMERASSDHRGVTLLDIGIMEQARAALAKARGVP